MIPVVDQYCTFPLLEKLKLWRLTLFNFLVGNEDRHLKNFSLIRRRDKVELTPAYDLVNTTLVLRSGEELALPLRGKKSRISRSDLVDYYAYERLGLLPRIIDEEFHRFQKALEPWRSLIQNSFLSAPTAERYQQLVEGRWKRLI